jgi:hypothetical protein
VAPQPAATLAATLAALTVGTRLAGELVRPAEGPPLIVTERGTFAAPTWPVDAPPPVELIITQADRAIAALFISAGRTISPQPQPLLLMQTAAGFSPDPPDAPDLALSADAALTLGREAARLLALASFTRIIPLMLDEAAPPSLPGTMDAVTLLPAPRPALATPPGTAPPPAVPNAPDAKAPPRLLATPVPLTLTDAEPVAPTGPASVPVSTAGALVQLVARDAPRPLAPLQASVMVLDGLTALPEADALAATPIGRLVSKGQALLAQVVASDAAPGPSRAGIVLALPSGGRVDVRAGDAASLPTGSIVLIVPARAVPEPSMAPATGAPDPWALWPEAMPALSAPLATTGASVQPSATADQASAFLAHALGLRRPGSAATAAPQSPIPGAAVLPDAEPPEPLPTPSVDAARPRTEQATEQRVIPVSLPTADGPVSAWLTVWPERDQHPQRAPHDDPDTPDFTPQFALDLSFDGLGATRLLGRLARQRLDLVMASEAPCPADLQHSARAVLAEASAAQGLSARLRFYSPAARTA